MSDNFLVHCAFFVIFNWKLFSKRPIHFYDSSKLELSIVVGLITKTQIHQSSRNCCSSTFVDLVNKISIKKILELKWLATDKIKLFFNHLRNVFFFQKTGRKKSIFFLVMKFVLVAEIKAQCLEANFLLFFSKKIFEKILKNYPELTRSC